MTFARWWQRDLSTWIKYNFIKEKAMSGPIPPRGAHHVAAPLNPAEIMPNAVVDLDVSGTAVVPETMVPNTGVAVMDAQMPPVTAKRIMGATIEDALALLEEVKAGYASRGFEFEYDLQFNVKKVRIDIKR